jgi:AraC family transcriptional activator of pobA
MTNVSSDLEIRTTSWLLNNQENELKRLHVRRQFMIVWIRHGDLVHCIDRTRYEVTNMLYCIAPGRQHQLSLQANTEGYMVFFDSDAVEGMNAADLLYKTNIFHAFPYDLLEGMGDEAVRDIEEVFRKLADEFDRHSMKRFELLAGFLKILLIYLLDCTKEKSLVRVTTKAETLGRFFSLLRKDYKTKKLVSDYAVELSITPSYLNEIVKGATGRPASHHIRQRIVSEAKRQASYFGLNMKQTAYLLGFDDLAHFSKYFKTGAGISFSDFRKQL